MAYTITYKGCFSLVAHLQEGGGWGVGNIVGKIHNVGKLTR